MILNRDWLKTIDFKVLGIDMGNNGVIRKYVKYYPDKNAILIADAHSESLYGYVLTKDEFNSFKDGKFAITTDVNRNNHRGIVGEHMRYFPSINCNHIINIHVVKTRKHVIDCVKAFEIKVDTMISQQTKIKQRA